MIKRYKQKNRKKKIYLSRDNRDTTMPVNYSKYIKTRKIKQDVVAGDKGILTIKLIDVITKTYRKETVDYVVTFVGHSLIAIEVV